MSDFNNIVYEVENGRARITLNRPEKLNALSFDLLYELHEAMWEADDNQDVHCVILRGAGRCLLYTSPSPRDRQKSRMPSSA